MFNYELKVKLWNSKQQVTNRLQSSFFHAMGVTGESSLPVAEKMAKKEARCNMSITPTLHRTFHHQLLCLFSSSCCTYCSCSFSFFCSSSFKISCTIFCAPGQSCIQDSSISKSLMITLSWAQPMISSMTHLMIT